MWQVKKQSQCNICKTNHGVERNLFIESCSYWHYSYGFSKHILCHWCYETLMLFEKPIPIDDLLSLSYKNDCEKLAISDKEMWTSIELNKIKTYIDNDNVLHVLLQITNDNGLRWSNYRNYTPDIPIYKKRTTLCNRFIALRQQMIDTVNIRNRKCNVIATVKILHYERSYMKLLPIEVIEIILSYYKMI